MAGPLDPTPKDSARQPPEAPAPADPGLAALLTSVFKSWRARNIPFLILRNYEGLPDTTSNDVDVLVPPEHLAQAERAMVQAALQQGYRLHNRIEFASLACFFFHPQSLRQIQIDLFHGLEWRGLPFLDLQTVLAARVDRGLFAIPSPVHEALASLLERLLQHGYAREKYRASILAGFREAPDTARSLLATAFGQRLADELAGFVHAENWAEVERLAPPLRGALTRRRILRHPLATVGSVLRNGRRALKRVLQPGGLTLALLGPDGSGKSTAGETLLQNLRNTFTPDKGIQVHWKPVVFFSTRRRPSGVPTVDPHGQAPRNPLASLAYLGGHWLEFFLGSQLQFRPVTFRGGLVLIDRYFYDFLIDQRRYRLQVPVWLVRLMFALLKRPDLVFLFDAPPEVLQARKKEVTAAETARQVTAFRHLVSGLSNGFVIDATRPPERVAEDVTRYVLQSLHERTRKRAGES